MNAHPESYGHWDHAQISELLHERDRLRASERSAWNAAVERDEKIERLRAEVAALKKDAERYRWLEERTTATGLSRWMGHHQFLSTAIDAARKEPE